MMTPSQSSRMAPPGPSTSALAPRRGLRRPSGRRGRRNNGRVMSGIGEVLTIARKSRGMTQAELAEAVGLTQAAINRYEAGERDPDEMIVAALADALGVTQRLLRHGDRFRG